MVAYHHSNGNWSFNVLSTAFCELVSALRIDAEAGSLKEKLDKLNGSQCPGEGCERSPEETTSAVAEVSLIFFVSHTRTWT